MKGMPLERRLALTLALPLCLLALRTPARAQAPASPDQVIRKVRLDQKLDAQVPLDVTFRDDSGETVPLRRFFGQKPVMLMLIQYRCRMLCTEEMNVLSQSLKELKFDVGKQFNLLTVSIDSREMPELAAAKKQNYLKDYGRPGAAKGWHFLTGTKDAITRLSDAVGFHFAYDPKTDQFAHPDGVILLTPEGKVARYYFRLNYAPRDLRLGLVEAASNKIGSPLDALALLCYHYNPETGKYSLGFMKVVRLAGLITATLLVVGVAALKRRDLGQRGA